MNFKKGLSLPIFLSLSAALLLVIVGIATYFVITERDKIPEMVVEVKDHVDKNNWKTYKSDKFGVELLHPETWVAIAPGPTDVEEDIFRSPDFEIEKIDRPEKNSIFHLVHGAQLNIYSQPTSTYIKPGEGAYKIKTEDSFMLNGDIVRVFDLYDSTADEEAKKYQSNLQIAYIFHGDSFVSVGMFYREAIYGKVFSNIVSTVKFIK